MKSYKLFLVKKHTHVDQSAPLSGKTVTHHQEIQVGQAHEWPNGVIEIDLWAFPNDGKLLMRGPA